MDDLKFYQLYCEHCHYRKIVKYNENVDFFEIPQSQILTGSPYIDKFTKKVVEPKKLKRARVFKCPNCGFAFRPKQIINMEPSNETDNTTGRETSST